MKIINPSFEILDRRNLNYLQKIEMFGRTAYKSEYKITGTSAPVFVENIIERGHFPVLEGAHIRIRIDIPPWRYNDQFTHNLKSHKYFYVHRVENDNVSSNICIYVSGTVRAFYDYKLYCEDIIGKLLLNFLMSRFNEIFGKFKNQVPYFVPGLSFSLGATSFVDAQNMCAVKFICNRAVSHELVRHRRASLIQESQRYCRYSDDKFENQITFIRPSAFFQEDSDEYAIWYESCRQSEKAYIKLLSLNKSPQAARTVLANSCKTEVIIFATIEEWKHIFALRTSPAAEPSMRELMIPLSEVFFNFQHLWE